MEAFIEIILGFFFELSLQLFGEIFCELGFRALAEACQGKQLKNPALASIGYFILGAAIGGLSLLFFGNALLHKPVWRILNLILTPVAAGLVMAGIGILRQKKGQKVVRLDRFGYGFIFAFGTALVRFLYSAK
jgi:hypothetical protein